jgi:TonB family protein
VPLHIQGLGGGSGGGEGTGHGVGYGPGSGSNGTLESFSTGVEARIQDLAVYHQVVPTYPSMAVAANIQGDVEVAVLINEAGRVVSVEVRSSRHPCLEAEVRKALEEWRFKPVKVDGKAVKVRTGILFVFHLLPKQKRP